MNTPRPLIHIVGPNKLQNDLLVSFLEMETELNCISLREADLNPVVDDDRDGRRLILLDCQGIDPADFWKDLGIWAYSKQPKCFIALFNVDPNTGIEKEAVERGMRGIFYISDPPMTFLKGVLAILNGEIWYSRIILSKCLLETRTPAQLSLDTTTGLTSREKEILARIASGASNKDIAADLCISLHTVKTHIHNIFRKIDVPNRYKAMLFVTRHLNPLMLKY